MMRAKDVMSRARLGYHRRWLAALVIVTAASLALVFAPYARAADQPKVALSAPAQSQVFNGDVTVEPRQVVEGDLVAYDGDVTVEDGGVIQGNLVVYSGDIEIAKGGQVKGDVTALSGDVQVDGAVGGSISAWSGDVDLGENATVGGDISVVSGQIDQEAGARVGGSVLRGPNLKLPMPAGVPGMQGFSPSVPTVPSMQEMTLFDRMLDFFGRMILALFVLAVAVAGAVALKTLRPAWVAELHTTLKQQTALSFAIGLIVIVPLLALIGFLYITVCLRPPALLLGLAFFGLTIVGLAAVGEEIGTRLAARFHVAANSLARIGSGVLVPGAAIAILWVLGGCFTVFALLLGLLVSSFGVGAVLVKVLKLGEGVTASEASLAPVPPPTPVRADNVVAVQSVEAPTSGVAAPPMPPVETAAVTEASTAELTAVVPTETVGEATLPVVTEVLAAELTAAAPTEAVGETLPPVEAAAATEVAGIALAADTMLALGEGESGPAAPAEVGAAIEASSVAADAEAVTPDAEVVVAPITSASSRATGRAEVAATEASTEVDFTSIAGIGPVFDRRLKAAGLRSFADLAAKTPEEVAAIIGWSVERVSRTQVIEQARALA